MLPKPQPLSRRRTFAGEPFDTPGLIMYAQKAGIPVFQMPQGASEADLRHMRLCIELALKARASGDHPVGALVVRDEDVLGSGVESTRRLLDISAHAEIEALRAACRRVGTLHLRGATVYTTVEPCYMCSFAIRQLGIARVVIGRAYPAAGGVSSRHPILCDSGFTGWGPPPVVVAGVLLDECDALFEHR